MPNPFNTTNYKHDSLNYQLTDICQGMKYRNTGEPELRVDATLNGGAVDAFGRVRVAPPFTLFDSFHRYQDNGKISVYTATNGTSTHDPNSSSIIMAVTNENGSKVYRESNRAFPYQPGKSLEIMMTFCMNTPRTNLRERIGYFDTANGIFLERNGSTVYLVRRSSSVNGSPVEERVAQADWNIDKLDGTGTSMLVLDLTKVQIFFMDIEWLGVGTVRCGFIIDGMFYFVHHFHHANILTTTYMGTACLPVRAEIENTAATDGSSSMRIICTTVISEGGYELRGRPYSIGHTLAAPYTLTGNTAIVYPVMSIRLKSTRLGGIVIPKNFSVSVVDSAVYRYQILSGAVTSGGTWVDVGATSSVEYNLTATSITNGIPLETGYIAASNQSASAPSLEDFPFRYQLERNTFTSTAYEFVIAVNSTGNNLPVRASINWEEVT